MVSGFIFYVVELQISKIGSISVCLLRKVSGCHLFKIISDVWLVVVQNY